MSIGAISNTSHTHPIQPLPTPGSSGTSPAGAAFQNNLQGVQAGQTSRPVPPHHNGGGQRPGAADLLQSSPSGGSGSSLLNLLT